jgi:F-type H+-transporting ATPase subunit gamma
MNREAEIQAHVASMAELRDIVGAMRSLAGMRIQEAHRALPGIRRYAESAVDAIGAALRLVPAVEAAAPQGVPAPAGIVLCAAEHGFVGGFNERLVDAAQAALTPADALFVLGSRGAATALERGLAASWTGPMATRPATAPDTVRRLTAELYRHVVQGRIGRVEVLYAQSRQGGAPTIERHCLLPLEPRAIATDPSALPPLHNLAPRILLEKLMAEYVFARLTEAAVESIAGENAARFAAMVSAHDNVSRKLDQLRQTAREVRQAEVTTELLDLITGTASQSPEASRAEAPSGRRVSAE